MHNKTIAFSLCLFGLGWAVCAVELKSLLPAEAAARLHAGEAVKNVQFNASATQLAPTGSDFGFLLSAAMTPPPGVLVEAAYLYRLPAGTTPLASGQRLALFNAVRAISSLAGIEYFSASRNRMRTFYETAFTIDDPASRRRQPDPVAVALPDQARMFAQLTDLTFGENVYEYVFYGRPSGIAFMQTNLSAMNYGIVPILAKKSLNATVLVIEVDEGLLVYSLAAVQAKLLPIISGKVRDSFSNRADAIYRWFAVKADAIFSRS
jgi:hypothetical protein